jgi:hypothetical protein
MAQVRLHLMEASNCNLPRVCLRCGQPALNLQTLQISWFPPWVNWLMLLGVIPYLIVSPLLTKHAVLNAPFCPRHANHWYVRTQAISIAILVMVFALGVSLGWYPRTFLWVLVILFPLVVIVVTFVHRTSVRPTEVTTTHLVIDGVCDAFVDALVRRDQAIDQAIAESDGVSKVPLKTKNVSDAIQAPARPLPPPNAIEEG